MQRGLQCRRHVGGCSRPLVNLAFAVLNLPRQPCLRPPHRLQHQDTTTHLSGCSQCERSVSRVTACRHHMKQILLLLMINDDEIRSKQEIFLPKLCNQPLNSPNHTQFSLYFSVACVICDLLGSPLLCSDVMLIFFSFPCFHILLFPSLVMRNGSQCSDAFSLCLCHSRAALCVISQCISTTWGESRHLWPFVMERALNGLLCNWHEHASGGCFNLGAFCTRTLTPGRYLLRFTHLTTRASSVICELEIPCRKIRNNWSDSWLNGNNWKLSFFY